MNCAIILLTKSVVTIEIFKDAVFHLPQFAIITKRNVM